MKKLLILLCVVAQSSWAYDVNQIQDKIISANHLKNIPPIVVTSAVPSDCGPLACNAGDVIYITPLLLEIVQNTDELALVIGHETAHQVVRDEMAADVLGMKYINRAGFNGCRGAQFLKILAADKRHPDGGARYENTGCSK